MLSAQGVIRGGAHDGWRYTFRRFTLGTRGTLRIELIAGDPGWPFPQEVSLKAAEFRCLEGIKGERSPRIDTNPLVAAAIAAGPPVTPTRAERLQRARDKYAALYLEAVAR